MAKVFTWLKGSGRLGSMKEIPYTGRQRSCNHSNNKNHLIAFRVTGYSNTRGDSNHVTALATKGPLSVGYKVASDFFKYRGGIYRKGYCSGLYQKLKRTFRHLSSIGSSVKLGQKGTELEK